MDGDAELAELRRRRMQQIQEMQAQAAYGNPQAIVQQQAEAERRDAERQEALRRVFTPEARERLARIRMTRPEVAQAAEQQVLTLAAQGRLQRMVDDATLRLLLERLNPERREINITRR
ncbi:MAG: DNA-binding protein [Thermoplasmata archaeon]|nr:DNA-binding protein [Thermoplasmata archaeon]MCI4344503.1 DNA-binding protein [Thermoplasmata archaeon]